MLYPQILYLNIRLQNGFFFKGMTNNFRNHKYHKYKEIINLSNKPIDDEYFIVYMSNTRIKYFLLFMSIFK